MFRLTCAMVVLIVFPPATRASSTAKPPTDDVPKRVEGYLDQALPGVFYSEDKDVRDGRIVRLFAVGTALVPDALGADEGLELARQRAQEAAREELVRFLASKVTVKVTARDEIVLAKDVTGGGLKETGKKVERRTREFEETATAVVRGLKVAGARQVGGEKRYVVVYRWDGTAITGAGDIRDRMEARPGYRPLPPGEPLAEKRVVVDD